MSAPDTGPAAGRVVAFGRTDVGRERSDNQDAFSMTTLGEVTARSSREDENEELGAGIPTTARLDATAHGFLFVVADGMGGAAGGEIASRLAVTTVEEVVTARWRQSPPATAESLADLVAAAVEEANGRIHQWASRHAEYRGMGSTLTAVGLVGRTGVVSHVGDSRAYLLREDRAVQLTEDQTVARKLVESGDLSPEEAAESSQAHVLLRAVGTEPEVRPETGRLDLRAGDGLLLCTDGLSRTADPDLLARTVAGASDPSDAVDRLVDRANAAGGADNVTVLLARLTGDDGSAPGH